jgi:hypothetical protein
MEASTDDLDWLRLKQERELKERELALRERELEIQRKSRTPWSTPVVVALVGGVVGYMGTLISSCQTRQLERDKQQGTLILEAIRTVGTGSEKEKQTAANLVFLADNGLITTIRAAELEKLRKKAEGAGPSLPAVQGVEFQRSGLLTADLQSRLQTALASYQSYLARIGYVASGEPISVRIDEEHPDNAFFDKSAIVIGRSLATDSEYALSEYTWAVLKQSNQAAFDTFWDNPGIHAQGFVQGLKFYLPCSHLNDPYVGRNFHALTGGRHGVGNRNYLFNLSELRRFDANSTAGREPHNLGEVWGAALWELRMKLGQDNADRLVMQTWKGLKGTPADFGRPSFYIDAIAANAAAMKVASSVEIRQPFLKRGLQ